MRSFPFAIFYHGVGCWGGGGGGKMEGEEEGLFGWVGVPGPKKT